MTHTLKLTTTLDQDAMRPYWPAVIEQLEEYVSMYPSHTTLDDLLSKIAGGELQLWIVLDNDTNECVMSVVTKIVTLDATGAGAVQIYALAGQGLATLAPMIHDIISWAKKRFAITEAEITGRPGIAKLLKPHGFTQEAVIMKRSA